MIETTIYWNVRPVENKYLRDVFHDQIIASASVGCQKQLNGTKILQKWQRTKIESSHSLNTSHLLQFQTKGLSFPPSLNFFVKGNIANNLICYFPRKFNYGGKSIHSTGTFFCFFFNVYLPIVRANPGVSECDFFITKLLQKCRRMRLKH